jgi:glycosyltransferase involved in cell wall biosynthesis
VTHFNELMWDNGSCPTRVIEHGVTIPAGVTYTGVKARGLVVVNGLPTRGRRLGLDIVEQVRQEIPLEIVGMQSERVGGRGEIEWQHLAKFAADFRFFFNPIRYTSLGLAVCEAMMLGMPVVGLATTEMPTVVASGRTGWVDTDVDRLILRMHELLGDWDLAHQLGREARATAQRRFNIRRFVRDWEAAFDSVTGRPAVSAGPSVVEQRPQSL